MDIFAVATAPAVYRCMAVRSVKLAAHDNVMKHDILYFSSVVISIPLQILEHCVLSVSLVFYELEIS